MRRSSVTTSAMRTADELDADYTAAGFGGQLPRGLRPALILVDFARAYFDLASPLRAGVESERTVAARLATVARAAGIPIVFTRVEYVPDDPARAGGLFYRKVPALRSFDRGNQLGDFTPELAPVDGDIVITKHYPSAFFATDLAERLRNLSVDTCVITGLSTSGCVRATTLDALCHGFVPVVVADACGDRDAGVQAANLFDIGAKYAEVTDSADVSSWLHALTRYN